MLETHVQSLGWEDLLEKDMATHSSILAWKIPWMEEHGRLHIMGSQRVGHDRATSLSLFHWCWSWSSNTLATRCEELTHLKRPWCWEGFQAGEEREDRGWDGWMASSIQWTSSNSLNLSKLRELVIDREAWSAAVHGVAKSWTRLSDWTELMKSN